LPGANTIAYYENSQIKAVKGFITLAPDVKCCYAECQVSDYFALSAVVVLRVMAPHLSIKAFAL